MKKAGSQIPLDLAREILLRLPARSVIRFRLACKIWRSTTVDPNFVETHLDLARKRKVSPPSILLAPSWEGGHDNDFTILDGDTWIPKQRFWSTPKLDNVSFHGSCNGIVCISGDNSNNNKIIQLLNPATGDSLTLPKSRNFFKALFGFHPVTKEYKVIIIYNAADPESTPVPGCQIYTIGTDTSWRDIDVIQDFEPYIDTVLNGVIYMVSDADTESIVSFDLKDESFKQFPFLDFGQDYYSESVGIIELQGIVCIYLKYVDERMEVWRLNIDDSGCIDNHRWDLIYSILPWDGLAPTSPIFIHQNKILTMSYLYSKHDADCYEETFTMVCYRYVNKGTIGLNKILYMHRGYYYIHDHLETLLVLPN